MHLVVILVVQYLRFIYEAEIMFLHEVRIGIIPIEVSFDQLLDIFIFFIVELLTLQELLEYSQFLLILWSWNSFIEVPPNSSNNCSLFELLLQPFGQLPLVGDYAENLLMAMFQWSSSLHFSHASINNFLFRNLRGKTSVKPYFPGFMSLVDEPNNSWSFQIHLLPQRFHMFFTSYYRPFQDHIVFAMYIFLLV